jgi:hypothetical protein
LGNERGEETKNDMEEIKKLYLLHIVLPINSFKKIKNVLEDIERQRLRETDIKKRKLEKN